MVFAEKNYENYREPEMSFRICTWTIWEKILRSCWVIFENTNNSDTRLNREDQCPSQSSLRTQALSKFSECTTTTSSNNRALTRKYDRQNWRKPGVGGKKIYVCGMTDSDSSQNRNNGWLFVVRDDTGNEKTRKNRDVLRYASLISRRSLVTLTGKRYSKMKRLKYYSSGSRLVLGMMGWSPSHSRWWRLCKL